MLSISAASDILRGLHDTQRSIKDSRQSWRENAHGEWARPAMSKNLAEGIALSHTLLRFVGAARAK
jgi:hypothetical protein